jgi:hypothetical protein
LATVLTVTGSKDSSSISELLYISDFGATMSTTGGYKVAAVKEVENESVRRHQYFEAQYGCLDKVKLS